MVNHFQAKVYQTKVRVHLPNSKVHQVLTPTPIPLPLPRVGSPKWGPATLQPQTTLTAASERSKACMLRGKIADIPI